MIDGIMLTIDDDGRAALYDDTWDITIHCESKEEQDAVKQRLADRLDVLDTNVGKWIPVMGGDDRKPGSSEGNEGFNR